MSVYRACSEESFQPEPLHGGASDDLRSGTSVLRLVDELQPGSTVQHSISFRCACEFAQFQGQSANQNLHLFFVPLNDGNAYF